MRLSFKFFGDNISALPSDVPPRMSALSSGERLQVKVETEKSLLAKVNSKRRRFGFRSGKIVGKEEEIEEDNKGKGGGRR